MTDLVPVRRALISLSDKKGLDLLAAGRSRRWNGPLAPAFGTLTGGMDAGDPAILRALQPSHSIDALLPVRGKLSSFPLWRGTA